MRAVRRNCGRVHGLTVVRSVGVLLVLLLFAGHWAGKAGASSRGDAGERVRPTSIQSTGTGSDLVRARGIAAKGNADPPEGGKPALPAGVGGDWWAAAQREIAASEYRVTWQEGAGADGRGGAYQAPNRAQGLRTTFEPEAIRIGPRREVEPRWSVGLSLRRVGLGETESVYPAALAAEGDRIEYRRGAITESYANDSSGLSQRITIGAPPPGGGTRLQIELAVFGNVLATPYSDGRGVEVLTEGGAAALRLADLEVTDSRGERLEARLALSGCASGAAVGHALHPRHRRGDRRRGLARHGSPPGHLAELGHGKQPGGSRIRTLGRGRRGRQRRRLRGRDRGGALYYDNGQVDEGRAFVYHGSASGLSTRADWTDESDQASARLRRLGRGRRRRQRRRLRRRHRGGVALRQRPDGRGAGLRLPRHGLRPCDRSSTGRAESNQASAYFGQSVAGAGDVERRRLRRRHRRARSTTTRRDGRGARLRLPRLGVRPGGGGGRGPRTSDQAGALIRLRRRRRRGRERRRLRRRHRRGAHTTTTARRTRDGPSSSSARLSGCRDRARLDRRRATRPAPGSVARSPAPGTSTATATPTSSSARISTTTAGPNEGRAFVYLGSASGLAAAAALDRARATRRTPPSGTSVATAGDVNGDGYADVDRRRARLRQRPDGRGPGLRLSTARPPALGFETGLERRRATRNRAWFGYAVAGGRGRERRRLRRRHRRGALVRQRAEPEGRAYVYHGSAGGLTACPPGRPGEQPGRRLLRLVGRDGRGRERRRLRRRHRGRARATPTARRTRARLRLSRLRRGLVRHRRAGSAEGDQAGAQFGSSVADGRGRQRRRLCRRDRRCAPTTTTARTDEGRAYRLPRLGLRPVRRLRPGLPEGDQADADFGLSVADGGRRQRRRLCRRRSSERGYFDNGQTERGACLRLPRRRPPASSATPSWTAESNQADAHFGGSVAGGGRRERRRLRRRDRRGAALRRRPERRGRRLRLPRLGRRPLDERRLDGVRATRQTPTSASRSRRPAT